MNTPALQHHVVDGFPAITLQSAQIAVTLVPDLGAKIVSLRRHAGAREWMWRPKDAKGLFACPEFTAFEHGPLIGADECLPTILPCSLDGVPLPDHGEVWTRKWDWDIGAGADPTVRTRIALRTLPLTLARSVSVQGNVIRLDYTLTNTGNVAVRYVWSLHPMFTWEPDDRIELAGHSDLLVAGTKNAPIEPGQRGRWPDFGRGFRLDRGEYGAPDDSFCKGFLSTARAARIGIVNDASSERLLMTVDPAKTASWGYWVSRGGWEGHTHWAIEPTNAMSDSPDTLSVDDPASTIRPAERRSWTVELALSGK